MKQPKLAKPPKQAFHRQLVGYAWTETAETSEASTKQKQLKQSNENHRENHKNQNEEHKPLKLEQGEPLTAVSPSRSLQ